MSGRKAKFPFQITKRIMTKAHSHPSSVLNTHYFGMGEEEIVSIRKEVIQDLLDVIIGENTQREGLQETPARVVKAWKEWTSGYDVDIAALMKVFEDGAEGYDEMVIVKDIPIYSKCEHHLADIFGTATIAYIPNGKVVGLSKLSRVADAFARRLQVQERLTGQIADALVEHLNPLGVGVIIKARHMCMESRGLCQQGHHTITSALRGALKTEPSARAEFMLLASTK
jgi:GTP cyclohydrolase I